MIYNTTIKAYNKLYRSNVSNMDFIDVAWNEIILDNNMHHMFLDMRSEMLNLAAKIYGSRRSEPEYKSVIALRMKAIKKEFVDNLHTAFIKIVQVYALNWDEAAQLVKVLNMICYGNRPVTQQDKKILYKRAFVVAILMEFRAELDRHPDAALKQPWWNQHYSMVLMFLNHAFSKVETERQDKIEVELQMSNILAEVNEETAIEKQGLTSAEINVLSDIITEPDNSWQTFFTV